MFSSHTYKQLFLDILLLLLVSFIPLFWFPKDFMITGHDAGYPIDIVQAYANRFFSWNSVDTFGQDTSMNMGVIPIHTVEAGFHALGLSLYDAQKFSFVFWFFGMLLSMYYFVYSLRRHVYFRYLPLLASVLYAVNFYLLELWKYGAGTTFSAYIALPLVMSFTLRYFLEGKSTLWWSLGVSLCLFLFNAGAGYSIPLFGGMLTALIWALVFFGFFLPKAGYLHIFLRMAAMAFGLAVFSLLLNAYWMLPFASYVLSNYSTEVALHGGTEGLLSWTDSVSKFTSTMNLMRLQGFPNWYDTVPPAYATFITSQPLFILISLLFAPLSFASLFFAKTITEKKILLYFVILLLLAIFFSAGTHPPTGALFTQLMIHIPGFSIFRSSQYKFIPALYFAFAFLFSYTVCRLSILRSGQGKLPPLAAFARFMGVIAVIAGLLLYHYPYFGNELFVWNKPLTTQIRVPDYVISFGEWAKKNLDPEKRILIMPRLNSTWRSEAYTWGYSSLYSLFNLIGLRPFVENTNVENEAQLAMTNRLYTEILVNGPLLTHIASILQTPYALLRGDTYYDLSWNKSDSPGQYSEALARSPLIKKVWEEDQWSVYSLPATFSGKIYTVSSVPVLRGTGNDVVSMLIQGYPAFVQVPQSPSAADALPGLLPKGPETHALPCASCLLDEQQGSPQISTPRILPGSFLYFLKSMREKSYENSSLNDEDLLIKRLGLSLTRAKEAATLIDLKRDTQLILETLERLNDSWVHIDEAFRKEDKVNINFSVVSKIDSYATTQKDLLLLSAGTSKERIVQTELASVISRIDTLLTTVKEYRNYWKYRKKYYLPEGVRNGTLFGDKLRYPTGENTLPVVPQTIAFGSDAAPIGVKSDGERISYGYIDFRGADSFILQYPEQKNLYVNRRQKTVITPKGNMYCQIGDVANFNWQQQYTITTKLDLLVSNDTVLYLKRIKNSEKHESLSDGELVNPDITFNLRTRDNQPQEFSFSGDSADVAASIYFCTLLPWSSEVLLSSIEVQPKLNMPLYMTPGSGNKPYTPVTNSVVYKKVDQTKFIIDVSGITFPTILIFNENFNRKWNLYEPKKWLPEPLSQWTDTWLAKSYADDAHFTVNGYANAWYLPQKPNGPLIVEFSPQKYFYQGILVTCAGIVVVGGVVLYMYLKRRRRS